MTFSDFSDRTKIGEIMKNEILKNREGRIIGRVNGEWLLDRSGQPVARYIETVDKTLTKEGRILGSGDQRLVTLNLAKR